MAIRWTASLMLATLLACTLPAQDVEWRAPRPTTTSAIPTTKPIQPAHFEPTPTILAPKVEHSQPIPVASSAPEPRVLILADDPPSTPQTHEPELIGPPRRVEDAPKAAPVDPPTYYLSDEPTVWQPMPGRAWRVYSRTEYMPWILKRMEAPALVTTAPTPAGSPPPSFGFIGQPGTTTLYGGGPIGNPFHHGGRFTAGFWFDDCQTRALEGSYFFLGHARERFSADSNAFAILTRPFFRLNGPNPQESGQLVAFPPGFFFDAGQTLPIPDLQGSVLVETITDLWGADVTVRHTLGARQVWNTSSRLEVYGGFRFLDLEDRLTIVESLRLGDNNPLVPPLPVDTRVTVTDVFRTRNQFYGGQVGLRGEIQRGPMFLEARGSLAIGGTYQVQAIDGSQLVTTPGNPTQTFRGGLLATPTNIGTRTNGEFSFVPEVGINLGVEVTPGLRVFAGYNFLYWTRVIRAGEQIDRGLDVNQVPNFVPPGTFPDVFPARPAARFIQNDFWAHGANIGVQVRW